MAELVKVYRQEVPAQRFIGKKYGDADRVNGGFGHKWGEFFDKAWFAPLEALLPGDAFEDADAYVGLMRWKEGEPFEYWIGMFTPAGSEAPEGYAFVDFDAAALGVVWVQGQDGEVYGQEERCAVLLGREGYSVASDENGAYWFFERYGCPRFTTPNEKGEIILDICHYVD